MGTAVVTAALVLGGLLIGLVVLGVAFVAVDWALGKSQSVPVEVINRDYVPCRSVTGGEQESSNGKLAESLDAPGVYTLTVRNGEIGEFRRRVSAEAYATTKLGDRTTMDVRVGAITGELY